MRERELDRIWRGLVECETVRDPDALSMWRGMAAHQLDMAVNRTVENTGMGRLDELMSEVDFRGW